MNSKFLTGMTQGIFVKSPAQKGNPRSTRTAFEHELQMSAYRSAWEEKQETSTS